MRVIPVLDVMNGIVVHAVAGERSRYQPLRSQITESYEPLEVANAMLRETHADAIYVADLDAIMRGTPQAAVIRCLEKNIRQEVWVDSGLQVEKPTRMGVRPIIALESFLPNPAAELIRDFADCDPIFSVDMRGGHCLGSAQEWGMHGSFNVIALVQRVVNWGIRSLIVLDLSTVGVRKGPGTEMLCEEIRRSFPGIELIVGGGIRNREDLARFESLGVNAALVATAIHERTLIM